MGIFSDIGTPDAGNSFLEQVAGGAFGSEYLRDYTHASRLHRSDAFANAPQQKFLFHVYFNLTDPASSPSGDLGLVGALVKSIQLPSFEINTEEYVQYNRKRLVHNKIEYQPVEITLHDDSSDNVRTLWYNYYNYYFSDPSHEYEASRATGSKVGYSGRNIYNPARPPQDWGFNTSSLRGDIKDPFFKDIQIYGMSRGNFVQYTLINPLITGWRGDQYDYSDATGTMEHKVTVKYEAVKYTRGKVGDLVKGFADPSRYDTRPSTLSKPGSTASIFGQGGVLDVAQDLADGNYLGALIGGIRAKKSFDNSSLSFGSILKNDLKNQAKGQLLTALSGSNRGGSKTTGSNVGFKFPSFSDLFSGNGNQKATPKKEG